VLFLCPDFLIKIFLPLPDTYEIDSVLYGLVQAKWEKVPAHRVS